MTLVPQILNVPQFPEGLIAEQLKHCDDDPFSSFGGPLQSLHEKHLPIEPVTVVIEHKAFVRDCLLSCLAASGLVGNLVAFASVEEWLAATPPQAASLVLLCVRERTPADRERALALLATVDAKVVLLAEDEETSYVLSALNKGIKGYIPMSVPFSVAVEAMRLVCAGGIFIPVSCLMNGHASASSEPPKRATEMLFTSKQLAVIHALRKGKSNKIIAYELNMAESTVKVHVRNIMRKLKAHNRTEVAFLINRMDSPA